MKSHFNDYVPSSELQKVSATFDRVRSGERIDLFELRLCKADGSRVHCEISATPMTKEGRLTGVQGIVRDISARKKIEEDLRMATEDLEFRVLERTADLVKANEDLAKEIAERQDIEKHITATNELLKLFTQTLLRNEYLDKIAVLLRDWCDCDGVGIRLIDEQKNIPYASFWYRVPGSDGQPKGLRPSHFRNHPNSCSHCN